MGSIEPLLFFNSYFLTLICWWLFYFILHAFSCIPQRFIGNVVDGYSMYGWHPLI